MLVIQKELIRLLEKKASRTWAEINFKKLRLLYLGGNEFISTIDGKKYSEHGEIKYNIQIDELCFNKYISSRDN